MFSVSIIQQLLDEELHNSLSFDDILFLSDIISNMKLTCPTHEEFQKLSCMAIVVKSLWLYKLLQFVTPYTDKDVQHKNIDDIIAIIKKELTFILQNLKDFVSYGKVTEQTLAVVRSYQTSVSFIEDIIQKGGNQSWQDYLGQFMSSLKEFYLVLHQFSPNLIHNLIARGISSKMSDDNKTSLEKKLLFFRRWKLVINNPANSECDMQWIKEVLQVSGISEALDKFKALKEASNFEQLDTRELQSAFSGYRDIVKMINETEKLLGSLEDKSSTESDNYDVCDGNPLATSSPNCIQQQQNCGSSSSIFSLRRSWKKSDDYLLYKGITKKLSWQEIYNAYFVSSGRSLKSLKSRWDKIQRNKQLLDSMRIMLEDGYEASPDLMEGNGHIQTKADDDVGPLKGNPWTLPETFSLYKGKIENHSLADIQDKYFPNNRRTIRALNARWYKISVNHRLMSTLKKMYKKERSLK